MAFVRTDDVHYKGIAGAIRGMHGKSTTYTPPEMVDFLNDGRVNLKPWNIAKGITIMGVTGTLEIGGVTPGDDTWPFPDADDEDPAAPPTEDAMDNEVLEDDPDVNTEDKMVLVDNEGNITVGYLYTAEPVESDTKLYNGVEFPDIDSVYTDTDKSTLPYAMILEPHSDNKKFLILTNYPYYVNRTGSTLKLRNGAPLSDATATYKKYELNEENWTLAEYKTGYLYSNYELDVTSTVSLKIYWTNNTLVDTDNDIDYLAASDPISPGSGLMVYNGTVLKPMPENALSFPYLVLYKTKVTSQLLVAFQDKPSAKQVTSMGQTITYYGTYEAGQHSRYGLTTTGSSAVAENVSGYQNNPLSEVLWANHDVFDVDGSLYLAGSEPTPYVGFEITHYDPATTEFKAIGWRRVSKHTTGEHAGEITVDDFTTQESGGWNYLKNIRMCTREKLYYKGVEVWPNCSQTWSYNGVELPALPKWDTKKYPYATLGIFNNDNYIVAFTSYRPYHGPAPGGGVWNPDGTDERDNIQHKMPVETAIQWGAAEIGNVFDGYFGFMTPFWTNYDLLNDDGTLYLAASTPIPV